MDNKERIALAKRLIADIERDSKESARRGVWDRPLRWLMNVGTQYVEYYGTYPVILSRGPEYWVGTKARFGYIAVSKYSADEYFTDEPIEWWESQGFTITYPPVLGETNHG